LGVVESWGAGFGRFLGGKSTEFLKIEAGFKDSGFFVVWYFKIISLWRYNAKNGDCVVVDAFIYAVIAVVYGFA